MRFCFRRLAFDRDRPVPTGSPFREGGAKNMALVSVSHHTTQYVTDLHIDYMISLHDIAEILATPCTMGIPKVLL